MGRKENWGEDPTPPPSHWEGRFLPEVEKVLREAGWYPGRVVPEEQMMQWLVIEIPFGEGAFQVRMFPAARRILREFGGLSIPSLPNDIWNILVDPFAGVGDPYNWPLDEWCADGALFPFGYLPNDHWCLYITGKGEIIDEDSGLVGRTIEEALTTLILHKPFEKWDVSQEKFLEASYIFPFMREAVGGE